MIKFKEKKDLVGTYVTLIAICIVVLCALLTVIIIVLAHYYNYDVTGIVTVTGCLMIVGPSVLIFNSFR